MEEKFSHAEEPEAARNSAFLTKEDLSSPARAKLFAAFELSRLQGKNTFSKDEKLKSAKLIEQLFKEGKSVSKDGFTLVYLVTDIVSMYPARTGFSVPKKNFKHAVDRNRAKRLMREVYRTRKIVLYEKLVSVQKKLALMWVYKGKELPTYAQAESVMLDCLEKIMGKL
jgi:ribonuclease P protein component